MADHEVRGALGVEHDDRLSDSEYGCIALDSLGAVVRTHAALVQEATERQRLRELADTETVELLEGQPV
jgi:hypothetical protein